MEKLTAEQSVNGIVNAIHGLAEQHKPPEISLGKVIAIPPEIKIAWNNIILEKEDLYIDGFLLKNYLRQSKGEMFQQNAKGSTEVGAMRGDISTNSQPKRGGAGRPSFTSHSHKINGGYKGSMEGNFESKNINSDFKNEFKTTNYGLETGDLVALLPIYNGQKFIILGKIYYLGEYREGGVTNDNRSVK